MKSDYSKLQKLTSQVEALGAAVTQLTVELNALREGMNMLAKVAHFHGEPEVAAKLEPQTDEQPSWEKSEFKNDETK